MSNQIAVFRSLVGQVSKLSNSTREMVSVAGFLLLAFALRLRNLDSPISGSYTFRNTQTAWGIRSVVEGHLSPFSIETPVLGPPWRIPFEFPLFQLFAGVFARFSGMSIEASGRLSSLLFFIATTAVLYIICRAYLSFPVSLAVVGLVLFCSHNLEYGSSVLIEYCALFFSLVAFFFARRFLFVSRKSTLFLFVVASATAGLVKITTSFVWVVVGSIALVIIERPSIRKSRTLIGLAILSHVPAVFWTRWADAEKSKSPMTKWLTSENLRTWNFGTFRQRLYYFDWHRAVSVEFLPSVVGLTSAAIALALVGLILGKNLRLSSAFTLILASGPLVFTNLYFVHDYYWTAVLPALAVLIGIGIEVLGQLIASRVDVSKRRVGVMQVSVALVLACASWFSPYGARHFEVFAKPGSLTSFDGDVQTAVETIRKYTTPGDNIVVIGADWNPRILYFSDRKGLMLPNGFDPSAIRNSRDLGTLYKFAYFYVDHDVDSDTLRSIFGDVVIEHVENGLYRFAST